MELTKGLQKLRDKAMGLDLFHNRMLQNLSITNRKFLLHFFNLSLQNGYVPEEWKCAIVTPILKPNKPPTKTESYRPISLTSCLGKLMEKIINNRLTWYIDMNNAFPKSQAGIRKGYQTLDHILHLELAIKSAFNSNEILTAIFLDLTKTYDYTWIDGLLFKIAKLGIKGPIFQWLKNFLNNRKIKACVNGYLSEEKIMYTSVPKGSVLSPTLFNIMMHDFPRPPAGWDLSLFADDIEFHTSSKDKEANYEILQTHLSEIEEWANKWRTTFSVNRCASLTFTRKLSYTATPPLLLEESPIEEVDHYKFLGITFDKKLNWNLHIEDNLRKTKRLNNLLRTLTFGKNCLPIPLLMRTYKAMIRSRTEYGALIFASLPVS